MCTADESYDKNPKYARSRMCACCGVAHEILAALLLGFLQFICWYTVGQNCYSGGGWVSDKARLDKDMLKQLEKRNCDPPATGYEKMCEAYTFYPDMIDGAKAFCDAQSSVLAISAVSIIAALVLFFVAIANACKCCESCCGGKQRKSFLNVIFSAVGALIALIAWIIYLGLNSAYTKYRDGLADINKVASFTSTPVSGTFYSFFDSALIICVIWMFFVILQRVVQGVLSFLASREEWKEGEMTNVQMAKV